MATDTIPSMGWKRGAINAAHRIGLFDATAMAYGPRRLTVLAYHRVVDHRDPGFVGFIGNVSATPVEFDKQMDWVAARFSVVTLDDLATAATGGAALPDHPLLITFDDGYRDNLENATPILEDRGLPAAAFLATDLVGGGSLPWWDVVAWCFKSTSLAEADLPVVGHRAWVDGHREAFSWIAAAKQLPGAEQRGAVDRLPAALELTLDESALRGLMLDWDQVATMPARGWQIGAHTRSHPILTRIPLGDAAKEIDGSRRRIAEVVGVPPRGFAYPNGQAGDHDAAVRAAVAEAGFEVAFTLAPGPARRTEYSSNPLAIRRVFVHHKDGISRLAAKTGGVARMSKVFR